MKKIIMALLAIMLPMLMNAQTFKVYQKDGTVVEFDIEKVDSVVFADKAKKESEDDKTVRFYWSTSASLPTTESEITTANANIHVESVSSDNTSHSINDGNAINCDGVKCIWVAIPSGWKLSSWTDNMGNEMANNFIAASDFATDYGSRYATIGTYTVYTRRLKININNKYVIKASH